MLRSKHFLILFAILAFGLFIEGLKSFRDLNIRDAEKNEARFSLKDLDTRPYHVGQSEIDREKTKLNTQSRGGAFRLAGQPQLKNEYNFSEGHNVAAALKAKVDSAAKNKPDTTKEKADKKKKKKKKKKTDEDKDKKNEESSDDQDGDSDEATDGQVAEIDSATAQFENQLDQTKKNSDLPVTFEDWAKLVLGRPQPENVGKLIEYFQNNMVTAEVFYSLLSAMLEESNPEQHKLAVYAAGNIHNAQSFNFLVDVMKNESQGTALASSVQTQLNSYKSLRYVGNLKAILTLQINDDVVVQAAVAILDKSTESYLENRTPSAEETTDPTTDAQKRLSDLAKAKEAAKRTYAGFEPILEQVLIVHASNKEITTPAQNSLRRIKTLIDSTAKEADESVKVADVFGNPLTQE